MNINAIIEEVTGEKGKWFLLDRKKIADIVERAFIERKKDGKPVESEKTYEQGLKEGFKKGELAGYAKRSDEMYEKAIIENFNLYIDRPDPDD
jgi:flagellar biosynthesis/type III secretory pathway protein FliH